MILNKNNDEEKEKPRQTNIENRIRDYFAARGIDTSSFGEVPITRLLPTRGNIPNPHQFAGAYMPGQNQIALSPDRATDPQMRMEEVLHAMQSEQMINPSISGKINKLANMLGVTEESPYEDQYAVLKGEGRDRDLEAEAKMTSLKIDLIDKGILDASGQVSEDDLYKIQQYMNEQSQAPKEQRSGAEYFLQPYFSGVDDEKQRELLLKILNKI
jgi:hypothetical protein